MEQVLRIASGDRLVLLVGYQLLALLGRSVLALAEAAVMLLSEDALGRGKALGGDVVLGPVADGCGLIRGCVPVERSHVVVEHLGLLVEGLEVDWVEVVARCRASTRCPSSSAGFVVELPALSVFAALVRELLVSLSSVGSLLAWLCRESPLEGLMALSTVWLLVGHHVGVKDVEVLR